MTYRDIKRMMQCITCGNDIENCECTEEDEDAEGMCIKWVKNDTDRMDNRS